MPKGLLNRRRSHPVFDPDDRNPVDGLDELLVGAQGDTRAQGVQARQNLEKDQEAEEIEVTRSLPLIANIAIETARVERQ